MNKNAELRPAEEATMTRTRRMSPLSRAPLAAACALLSALLLGSTEARAQWTQPNASGNINNTNTGNVGVGTTAPETSLHVSTSSTAPGRGITNEQSSNDGNSSVFTFKKSRAGAAVQNTDNIGNVFAAGSDGTSFIAPARLRFTVDGTVSTGSVPVSIQFFTGSTGSGTERMRITSGGHVGIGTTAPLALLQIGGYTTFNNSTAPTYSQFINNAYFGDGSWRYMNTDAASLLQIKDGLSYFTAPSGTAGAGLTLTERLRVTNAGNVGIGTGSPAALLHLFSTGNYSHGIVIDAQGTAASQQATIDFLTLGDGTKFMAGAGTKGWHFTARGNAYTTAAEQNDIGLFYWNGSGFTTGAYWDSLTGNMGVGNASPTQKLDVTGNVNAAGLCLAGDCKTAWSQVGGSQWTTAGSNVYFNGGNVGIGTASPVTRLHVGGQADNLFQVVSTGSAATDTVAHLSSAAGSIMVVRGNGNVGIGPGMTSPGETLMVNGKVSINRAASPGPAEFRIYNGGAAAEWSFRQAGAASHNLNISKSASGVYSDFLTIDTGGNVGVGTTSPASKLFVGSGTPAVATLPGLNVALGSDSYISASNNTVNTFIGADASTPYGIVGTLSNHPLGLRANNQLAMTITAAGNVGVGNASPTQKLDVTGNVNAAGLCLGGDCKTAWSQVGGGTSSQWTTAGSSIHFSSGNVGVGTATPGSPLDVVYNDNNFLFGVNVRNTSAGQNALTGYGVNNAGGARVGQFTYVPSNYAAASLQDTVLFSAVGATTKLGIISSADGTGTPDIYFRSGANSPDSIHIQGSTGNVGIGTNAPSARLEVNKGGGVAVSALSGSAAAGQWTAFQLGRAGADGSLGVASQPGEWATGSAAGDVILRTESASSKLILNSGSGASTLVVTNGNVGVGTASPSAKLDVTGSVNASGLCLGGDCKTAWSQVGGSQWTTAGSSVSYNTGNVGIGTNAPGEKLEVRGNLTLEASANPSLYTGTGAGELGRYLNVLNSPGYSSASGLKAGGVLVSDDYGYANPAKTDLVVKGRVGIGTAGSPAYKLDVAGAINASGAITGGTIEAKYQDVAEWVPSTQKLAAGTVVILDEGRTNHVVASGSAYDTKVAGVISEQPGVILGVGGEGKLKVATTGRVKVKVDASRGAIKVGDLLVTSEVEGVAMKSVPVNLGGVSIHRPGTIIGKALEPLANGVGEILVLLSLQ